MDTLITGGAGFIGHNLWKKYGGFRVDDHSKGKREVDLEIDCASEYFESWVDSIEPQHIVHLCGQSSNERSFYDPSNDFVRNVMTTRRLLSACENYNVKSITLASSMSAYGNNGDAKESDRCNPLSWYGRHKLMAEELLEEFSRKHPSVICNSLRIYTCYGSDQDKDDMQQGMISIYESMAEQGEITVRGSGDRIRNFIHVDDLCDGIALAVHRIKGNPYEVINMGTGVPRRVSEIIQEFDCPVEYVGETPDDLHTCNADMSKAVHLLGYIPKDQVLSYLKNSVSETPRSST
tara:strand:- start:1994 stop:2869 length:876 start_codon:yes stop_codon:yes gene_type:complete